MNKLYIYVLITLVSFGSYLTHANELQDRIDPKNQISQKLLQNYKDSVLMSLQAIPLSALECSYFSPTDEIGVNYNFYNDSNLKSDYTAPISKSQNGFLSQEGEQPILVFEHHSETSDEGKSMDYISVKTASDEKNIIELNFHSYRNEKILATDLRNPLFKNQYNLRFVKTCRMRIEQLYQDYMKKLN